MTASLTTIPIKPSTGTDKNVQVLDLSGAGTGPYEPVHVIADGVTGAPISPALDATVANVTTALGTDGTSPPTLPGGSTGVRGWLRYLGSLLSGTLTVSGSVSVSNLAGTQPISAAALPLPAGAATAAKQPALGTAGTASADVLSIQGVASMTPIKVDASATTQPVSAVSLPLPAGAATSAAQTTAQTSLSAIAAALASTLTAVLAAGSAVIGKVGIQVGGADVSGANQVPVADPQNLPVQGVVAITPSDSTTLATNRGVGVIATVAGNVALTLMDASTITLPAAVGYNQFPFQAAKILLTGTTATATFYILK